jgi:hypothetical protein
VICFDQVSQAPRAHASIRYSAGRNGVVANGQL